jgi:hypothetical protein
VRDATPASAATPCCEPGNSRTASYDSKVTYLVQPDHPRIVLLDCADDVVAALRNADYDVVVGYTGYFAEHPEMDIPSHLHEKDLLIVDLDPGWTPRPSDEVLPPAAQCCLEPR